MLGNTLESPVNSSYRHSAASATNAVGTTAEGKTYTANNLNQYTAIDDFAPQYDADGNQTLIKTESGVWSVVYNAENRPIRWQSGDTVITMSFDRLGRRVEYQETRAGQVATHFRFVYDNFLCVQRLNAANGNAVRTEFVWDPTEPIATRPLVMRAKNWDLNLFYTHDGNKNVSELFYHAPQNGIAAHYDYAPFGAVTRTSRATRVTNRDLLSENPFRFSSEYYDFTLDLVYYNHRHYNPGIGRWSGRDPLEEMLELNLYTFSQNDPLRLIDRLGLSSLPEPCPDDIKSRKIYKTSSRIMNGLIYRIYTYRSTTQARSVTTNGCSVPPMFAWLPLASLHMRIFNDACNKHDSCYGRCSSDKTQCDKLFLRT